jgi:hypothetical protein
MTHPTGGPSDPHFHHFMGRQRPSQSVQMHPGRRDLRGAVALHPRSPTLAVGAGSHGTACRGLEVGVEGGFSSGWGRRARAAHLHSRVVTGLGTTVAREARPRESAAGLTLGAASRPLLLSPASLEHGRTSRRSNPRSLRCVRCARPPDGQRPTAGNPGRPHPPRPKRGDCSHERCRRPAGRSTRSRRGVG